LKSISDHIRKSVEMAKLKSEVETFKEKAFKDALTGAYTRVFFNEWIKIYEKELERRDEVSSVVVMDVDCLKAINDNYGHDFGDMILRMFAEDVMKKIRGMDVFVRWGGDEFVLILRKTGKNKAETAIGRIRSRSRISFSYGIAEMTKEKPFEEAFKEADKSLYEMKEKKKSCENLLKCYLKFKNVVENDSPRKRVIKR
jgi:two-component system cell cycle response regulator